MPTTLTYDEALLELNDRAGVFKFVAVAWGGPSGPILMSAQGELSHWTSGRAASAPAPILDMVGQYRVGNARIDLDADSVETVERVTVVEPDDGFLFRMRGGSALRLSWHGGA